VFWGLSIDDDSATLHRIPPSPPHNLTMGKNTSQNSSAVDISAHGPAIVSELKDVGDHIAKLKQVTLTTQNLVNFLGGQLQDLSRDIPVLRGFQAVCLQVHFHCILA
jgi:hypothetical protein